MARHIELEPPSVNNLVQFMNNDLSSYEKDRKHKFVNMVFKKLTEKIEDGISGSKDDYSPSNNSTAEDNTSEDDNIDSSMNYLDSSENISD